MSNHKTESTNVFLVSANPYVTIFITLNNINILHQNCQDFADKYCFLKLLKNYVVYVNNV